MIYLVNFANEAYRPQQKDCSQTGLKYGKVDKVIEYTDKDLEGEYRTQNPRIANIKRGFGLWLWKPYLILKAMESMQQGDILVYADSGMTFFDDVHHLLPYLETAKNDTLLFDFPLLSIDWTKAEAFEYSGCWPDDDSRQFMGNFVVLKVSEKSRKFIKEWYEMCRDERILSPEVFDASIPEQPYFKAHREDQSVLSIVAKKNGMEALPDPSDYGEFDFLFGQMGRCNYRPKGSRPYPTIVLCNRKVRSAVYRKRFRRKRILHKLGLYNGFTLTIKNRIKKLNLRQSVKKTIQKIKFGKQMGGDD